MTIRGADLRIVAGRFELRSMDRSAAEALGRWMADPRVSEGLARSPRAMSVGSAEAYISGFDNRDSYLLGIHERASDRLIGFYTLHVDRRNLTVTGSLVVGEADALNQAVAAETARALADWAFERAGLHKFIAVVAETNSLVADWLGKRMRLEGRLRDEILSEDKSQRITLLRFGLLKSEWAQVREYSISRQAERGL